MPTETTTPKILIHAMTWSGIVFILLHLVALRSPSAANWGYHHLAFVPLYLRFIVLILMFLCTLGYAQERLLSYLTVIGEWHTNLPRPVRIIVHALLVILAGVLFWLVREKVYFLGDGYLFIRNLAVTKGLDQIASNFKDEPLAGAFIWLIDNILLRTGFHPAGDTPFQVLSIISGAGFLAVLPLVVRSCTPMAVDRLLISLFILSAGGTQIFFGYVETYPLSYLLLILFVYLSVSYLKSAVSLVYPSFVYGILFTSYFGMINLVPLLAYLFYIGFRRREFSRLAISLLAAAAGPALILGICGYSPASLYQIFTLGGKHFVQLAGTVDSLQSYTFFDPEHFIDLFNLHILLAPFSLLIFLLFIIFRFRTFADRREVFVFGMLCAGCCFLFPLLLNPELGMSRDWDLFAPYFLGILFSTALLWAYLDTDPGVRRRVMVLMTGMTLLHSAAWIGANGSQEMAMRRFALLQDRRYWGRHAITDANEELAIYYREKQDFPAAIRHLRIATGADSTHARLWSSLGYVYYLSHMPDSAIGCYERAIHFDSSRWKDYVMLGALLSTIDNYDEAIRVTEQAIRVSPDSAIAYDNLGDYLCMGKQAYEEAIPYFLRSIELDPTDAQSYYDLGLCYYAMGKRDDMVQPLERFLRLEPEGARAADVRSLLREQGEK